MLGAGSPCGIFVHSLPVKKKVLGRLTNRTNVYRGW
jgi:hypothetical protein